jgi:hypothetical protein
MKTGLEAMVVAGIVVAGALGFAAGCQGGLGRVALKTGQEPAGTAAAFIQAGTPIDVTLTRAISSQTARPGDRWEGAVIENVVRRHDVVIAAGSRVTGVVTLAVPAHRGRRAMLELAIETIDTTGAPSKIDRPDADAPEPGASLGLAATPVQTAAFIGPGTNDAIIAGRVAGTTAARVMAIASGTTITLKEGAVMSFTVDRSVAVR